MEHYDVVIIGAGPAGLFCAIHAAAPGHRILLLEKNYNPGAKLLISGSGQCNITHTGEMRDFLSHYGEQGKQVKPALFGFTNHDLIDFFRERGLAMVADENGKVFPETRQSSDVLALLSEECRVRDIDLRCSEPVTRVTSAVEGFAITTAKATYNSPVLAITTGGISYPQTGSTGDGYRIAESLGQRVTEPAPALTPLLIRNFPFAALLGISFEHMRFSAWRAGKKIGDYRGDVLFTHLGLSGPGILDASRYILPGDVITVSFAGNLKREEFVAALLQRIENNRSWQVSTILASFPIPERVNRKLLNLSGIPDDLTGNHLSAEQRSRLIANCTQFPLTVTGLGGFSLAMVTRGGVALDRVNLKTMESRTVQNLYFAGEVLDIDGDTGGYNLQAAFSTGFLAGHSIRKKGKGV